VGNGGTTGAIGTNSVADSSVLSFNRSDSITFGSGMSGTGMVVQAGSGTLTITAVAQLSGAVVASNGTLVVTGPVGADLDVRGGTVVPGGVGTISALSIGTNMNITSGTVVVDLNKALAPAATNSMFVVTGAVTSTGGTLKLRNLGPAVQV